ncbi:Proteasome subunit beta type-3 [Branchiostoma belcheri]|nr:Proteasome subunit beta type-3 [Branchiostoma belcheri]
MSYNGAAIIAMVGKDCVAIAADRRFGVQAQTVSMDFQKVFQMGDRLFLGLPGLATDVQTVANRMKFRRTCMSYVRRGRSNLRLSCPWCPTCCMREGLDRICRTSHSRPGPQDL